MGERRFFIEEKLEAGSKQNIKKQSAEGFERGENFSCWRENGEKRLKQEKKGIAKLLKSSDYP